MTADKYVTRISDKLSNRDGQQASQVLNLNENNEEDIDLKQWTKDRPRRPVDIDDDDDKEKDVTYSLIHDNKRKVTIDDIVTRSNTFSNTKFEHVGHKSIIRRSKTQDLNKQNDNCNGSNNDNCNHNFSDNKDRIDVSVLSATLDVGENDPRRPNTNLSTNEYVTTGTISPSRQSQSIQKTKDSNNNNEKVHKEKIKKRSQKPKRNERQSEQQSTYIDDNIDDNKHKVKSKTTNKAAKTYANTKTNTSPIGDGLSLNNSDVNLEIELQTHLFGSTISMVGLESKQNGSKLQILDMDEEDNKIGS